MNQKVEKERFVTKNSRGFVKHESALISILCCLWASGVDNLAIIVKLQIYHRYLNFMKGYQCQRSFVLLLGWLYIFQQDNGSKLAIWVVQECPPYNAQKWYKNPPSYQLLIPLSSCEATCVNKLRNETLNIRVPLRQHY